MTALCPNCRNAIPEGAAFCPECGAPQLRVGSAESRAAEEVAVDPQAPRHTGEIAWPAALESAAICAVPAGLLLSFLAIPLLDMLWVVLGAVWTLRRYRRRAPRAPVLTPILGGRIGLVLGLFAALVSTCANVLTSLFVRYGLHKVPSIDTFIRAVLQAGMDRTRATNPDAFAQVPELAKFWLSANGRGTLLLFYTASSVISILLFAWLGGRFAVRYGGPRRKPQ